jgi:hypothetical protein
MRKLTLTNHLYALLLAALLAAPLTVIADEKPALKAEQPVPGEAPAAGETDEQYAELKKTVGAYMAAWEKEEYDKMQPYESFEGGKELKAFHYIQSFTPDFGLSNWQVSKIKPEANDEYLVLVMVMHNPPKQIATRLPEGKKVRSTLRQYWKKQGDSYVHLFHIEKQRLLGPLFKMQPPQVPKPAKDAGEVKQDGA